MSFVTLKDKGQLTLPATVRKQLNASVGDMFDVQLTDKGVLFIHQKIEPMTQALRSKEIEEALNLTNSFPTLSENTDETPQEALKNYRKNKPVENLDISEFIGSMKGKFGDIEKVDDYIRNERTSWD